MTEFQESLTDAEKQVAVLVAQGMTNAAIAQRLGKSQRTVESCCTSIYSKCGIPNRTTLASLILTGQIIL
jgi:DNA-binding NarL/FixJ family response regulator